MRKLNDFDVYRFRKVQTIISILTFISIFLFSWNVNGFSITDIQLSNWGISEIGWIWNTCLVMLSISIYINVYYYIRQHSRMMYKEIFQILFFLVSFFLLVTAVASMEYTIHHYVAYLYFFLYPLVIFSMAYMNRKNIQYKEWIHHVIVSSLMIILPLILMKFFVGDAIAESSHSMMVIYWNIWILRNDC